MSELFFLVFFLGSDNVHIDVAFVDGPFVDDQSIAGDISVNSSGAGDLQAVDRFDHPAHFAGDDNATPVNVGVDYRPFTDVDLTFRIERSLESTFHPQ